MKPAHSRPLVVTKHSYKPSVSRRQSWWTAHADPYADWAGFTEAWRTRHAERITDEVERRQFQKTNPSIGYWKTDQP